MQWVRTKEVHMSSDEVSQLRSLVQYDTHVFFLRELASDGHMGWGGGGGGGNRLRQLVIKQDWSRR